MEQSNILNTAKNAKSIEELKQIAVDNGIALTDEKAKFYFSMLNENESELSLDEMAAATGGMSGDVQYNPPYAHCSGWRCRYCGAVSAPKQTYCYSDSCSNQQICCNSCVHFVQFQGTNPSNCGYYADDGGGGCG